MRYYIAIALCAFLIMTVGASRAEDRQYHRDAGGNIVIQVNPGANTTGPFYNDPVLRGSDFLYARNVGTPVDARRSARHNESARILYEGVDLSTVFPEWHRVTSGRKIVRRSIHPYMKICKTEDNETTCEEFDMGVVK